MSVTSSVELHVPFVIVHLNVAAFPAARFVNVEAGEFGLDIVAEPETTVHKPVPTDGLFPASVNVLLLQFD